MQNREEIRKARPDVAWSGGAVATNLARRNQVMRMAAFMGGLIAVLLANGLVPFLTLPTMGQAVWATSFAESLAHQPFWALTANSAGLPQPAPVAFGLSAVYPIACLLRAGLDAADAYTIVFAGYTLLAYLGCCRACASLGLRSNYQCLLAATWLCLPIVWAHAGYSMLSLGIALLPTYIGQTLRLHDAPAGRRYFFEATIFIGACLISVFMDGYTFVMFALATGIAVLTRFICERNFRRRLFTRLLPVEAVGFGISYLAYANYSRGLISWYAPIEAFRGWGVDASFLMMPTRGVSWILDSAHLSVARSVSEWYGDVSVWETTFILPLLVAVAMCLVVLWRRRSTNVVIFVLITAIGFYMSLGPSLKAWSTKPASAATVASDPQNMPATAARLSTGSAWLSTYVPGLKSMRASYRWVAMGSMGLWLLLVSAHALQYEKKKKLTLVAATVAVLALGIPPPHEHLRNAYSYRKMFQRMDTELVGSYGQLVKPGERVAFIPWNNDFLMGYAASRLRSETYNIAGDKNLAFATAQWPTTLAWTPSGALPSNLKDSLLQLLTEGDVDAVLVPFFQEPQASHIWPCLDDAREKLSRRVLAPYGGGWDCPKTIAEKLRPSIDALTQTDQFEVRKNAFFASIRLKNPSNKRQAYASLLASHISYPVDFSKPQPNLSWMLPRGWAPKEENMAWSTGNAKIELPSPASCLSGCAVDIAFVVYAAYPSRPGRVTFHTESDGTKWEATFLVRDQATYHVRIPLPPREQTRTVYVDVPTAVSPFSQGISGDSRVLGVGLQSADLVATGTSFP